MLGLEYQQLNVLSTVRMASMVSIPLNPLIGAMVPL